MKSFTNETIDLDQLPAFEHISLSRPHPDYWKVIVFNLLLWLAVLGACLIALCLIDPEVGEQRLVIGGSFLIFAVLLFIIYWASFKKRGYALREKDLIYKSGIIAETTTIVPLNRIQHVELNEGFIPRIFRLAKLQVFTAGGQSGHLGISGIEVEKAKRMKDMLLKKIDQLDF